MVNKFKKYVQSFGPGVVTGAADDDPSGIATYSQTGAQYGNGFLWTAILTFPMMVAVQEMCARIGIVTGRGLAGNIRIRYSRHALYICTALLFIANTFNIGANLAVMGEVAYMLSPIFPFFVYVGFFTLLSLILQIYVPYKHYVKFIKYLTFVLLAYIAQVFFVEINWSDIAKSVFLPDFSFTKEKVILLSAILGTTISPYLFFWQTSQEVEEEISHGKVHLADRRTGDHTDQISNMRTDVWSGMFFSNLVMFFVIAMCAVALNQNGITSIETAKDAAEALRPFAGEYAYILFSVGIIGTGLLSIPVLPASSGYAFAETFRKREGLYRSFKSAKAFYYVIIFSMLVALGITFSPIDPIKTLLYSAVLNGIVSPIMLFFIVDLSRNKKVMGKYVNKKSTTILGFTVTAVMTITSLSTIWFLVW